MSNTNLDTSTIIRRLEKIQAMVVCARHTAKVCNALEGVHAATILMEADNLIFDLMCNFDPYLLDEGSRGANTPAEGGAA